jgi:hypothetical protein
LLERGLIEGKKLGHDWFVLSLNYKMKRIKLIELVKEVIKEIILVVFRKYLAAPIDRIGKA